MPTMTAHTHATAAAPAAPVAPPDAPAAGSAVAILLTPPQALPLVRTLTRSHVSISVDIETTGLDPWRAQLVTLQLGDAQRVAILDVRHMPPEERPALRELVRLLLAGGSQLMGHNLAFDLPFLMVQLDLSPAELRTTHVWDTMLAEQVLLGGREDERGRPLSAGLHDTAARHGYNVPKEARSYFVGLDTRPDEWAAPLPAEQLIYVARDVAILPGIRAVQAAKLSADGLDATAELEMQAFPAVIAMTVRGLRVDTAGWRAYIERLSAQADSLAAQVQEILYPAYRGPLMAAQRAKAQALAAWESGQDEAVAASRAEWEQTPAGTRPMWGEVRAQTITRYRREHPRPATPAAIPDTLNLKSPKQLREALALAGIPMVSTDEEHLTAHRAAHPSIPLLLEWRELDTVITRFGLGMLAEVKQDGRIHPRYRQIGAEDHTVRSGRMSCSDPNVQQFPRPSKEDEAAGEGLRRHVIASEAHLILSCDYSNIEARVTAERSQDRALLALFAAGGDMHARTAIDMFGLPADTPEDKTREMHYGSTDISLRDASKTINYMLLFGAGPRKLADMLGCELSEARTLLDTYEQTYPDVMRYLERTAGDAVHRGYSRTLGGRRRNFALGPAPRRGEFTSWDAYLMAREGWRIQESQVKRQAANAGIQGTAADILKQAITLVFSRLPDGCYLVGAIHDELLIEAPVELADKAAEILASAMQEAARMYLPTVALGSFDVTRAPYWAKG